MKTILRRSALALAAVLALSGCVKLDMDLKLSKDEKVSGSMVVAFASEMLAMMGQTEKQFLDEMKQDQSEVPKGVTLKTYKKNGWIGMEYKMTSVPASEFSSVANGASSAAAGSTGGSGDDFNLVKVGGKWRLTGTMDMGADTGSDSSGMDPTAMMSMFKNKPELKIKMTFPKKPKRCGKDKTAKISGNTAEWTPKMGDKIVMCAEA